MGRTYSAPRYKIEIGDRVDLIEKIIIQNIGDQQARDLNPNVPLEGTLQASTTKLDKQLQQMLDSGNVNNITVSDTQSTTLDQATIETTKITSGSPSTGWEWEAHGVYDISNILGL